MIESQIEDRTRQREIARNSVRASWTGEQDIFAALLVIPYQEKRLVKSAYSSAEKMNDFEWLERRLYITPDSLDIDATVTNQSLSKGIYRVPVYTADININGIFELEPYKQLTKRLKNSSIRFKQTPFISIGIKDMRGVNGIPKMEIAKEELSVNPGTLLEFYSSGFNAKVQKQALSKPKIELHSQIKINGMEQLSFLSVARENNVNATSDWPHPIFSGAFLPTKREVTNEGYSANWQTGIFSTNIISVLKDCYQGECHSLRNSLFGVKHIQSVDIYLQSLRSIKYGMLIILVTFCIFVLYEILSNELVIHPISYVLTGFALALFFLLLIALSEHISFASAAIGFPALPAQGLLPIMFRFKVIRRNKAFI